MITTKKINLSILFGTALYLGISVFTHTVSTKNVLITHNEEFVATLAMLEK